MVQGVKTFTVHSFKPASLHKGYIGGTLISSKDSLKHQNKDRVLARIFLKKVDLCNLKFAYHKLTLYTQEKGFQVRL